MEEEKERKVVEGNFRTSREAEEDDAPNHQNAPEEGSGNGGVPTEEVDLYEASLRGIINGLFQARDMTGKIMLHPARDVKLDNILQRQALMMNALAFLLDSMLLGQGLKSGINVSRVPVARDMPRGS